MNNEAYEKLRFFERVLVKAKPFMIKYLSSARRSVVQAHAITNAAAYMEVREDLRSEAVGVDDVKLADNKSDGDSLSDRQILASLAFGSPKKAVWRQAS